MALNSDRDGFLLPDERLSADELAQGIRGIKRNTDAILSLLRSQRRSLDRSRITNPNSTRRSPGGIPGPAPAQRQTSDRASVPVPGGSNIGGRTGSTGGGGAGGAGERDSRGRFVRDPGADVAGEVRQMTRQQAQQSAERQRAEESRRSREGTDDADGSGNRTRDARGRFGSGGGSGSGADEDKSVYGRMKEFFKDRSGGPALDGADKVDPVIESAKEVMGMVGGAVGAFKATGELGRAVIGRGFGGPKREEGATPWFKRMLQQLKLMRRDDAQHNRAELRALNEPQAGGGGVSIITDILKLILSPIGAAIVAALAGIWMGWGKDIIGGWNGFIDGVKAKWDSAVDAFMRIWEPIAKFFGDKFGLVTDTAAAVGNKANEAIRSSAKRFPAPPTRQRPASARRRTGRAGKSLALSRPRARIATTSGRMGLSSSAKTAACPGATTTPAT
jgi:hypothetical protein